MRAKQVYPKTFQDFYDSAPAEIKTYIDRCEKTEQTPHWHPEGNVKIHMNIVFNRAKRTEDINLMLAAIFHDLGKADKSVAHPTIPNKWSTMFHEKVSGDLVKRHSDWIVEMGGDPDIVFYIVDQHMRVKNFDEMKSAKKEIFQKDKYFDLVRKFSEFDDMRKDYSNDTND